MLRPTFSKEKRVSTSAGFSFAWQLCQLLSFHVWTVLFEQMSYILLLLLLSCQVCENIYFNNSRLHTNLMKILRKVKPHERYRLLIQLSFSIYFKFLLWNKLRNDFMKSISCVCVSAYCLHNPETFSWFKIVFPYSQIVQLPLKMKYGEVRTAHAHIFYRYTSVIVWRATLHFDQKRKSKQK